MSQLIRHDVGTATIRRADAHDLPLEDESVDLIVTSPPYFALRSYTDGGEHYDGQIGSEDTPQAFLEALWAVTAECQRVLKPSGSMWVNLGDKYSQRVATRTSSHQDGLFPDRPELKKDWKRDRELGLARMPADNVINRETGQHIREKSLMGLPWRYAIGCIDNLGLILRAEVVWSKPNGLPESVTDRVRRSHEQWFHFVREPRYFAAVDEVREPQLRTGNNRNHTERVSGNGVAHRKFASHPDDYNPLGKLPGSVWTIPSEPLKVPAHIGVDHFAAFPQEWPRRLILGWSPPDGVILDPFGGTGTVAMVARALGRYGISFDLSSDYLRLARWRVWKSGHEYKTHAREWAEANGAVIDGKVKVPAKVKRQIEAEMLERQIAGRRLERDAWSAVCRG